MKHFYRLAQGIMTIPAMDALMRHPELWNALSDPQQIVLRANPEFRDTEAVRSLSHIKRCALDTMTMLGCSQLGGLVVQKIAPTGKVVFRASGKDDPFSHYRMVLHAHPGVLSLCGEETVNMEPGELWWVDTKTTNAINNQTPDDVVHVLVHLRHDA